MTHTDPTGAALLAACAEHPDEMDCALRYADWLEAEEGMVRCTECGGIGWGFMSGSGPNLQCQRCNGSGWLPHPRAEFIRVQCEIERMRCFRRELHAANGGIEGVRALVDTTRSVLFDLPPHPVYAEDCRLVREINVAGVRETQLLRQHEGEWRKAGACPECGGTGWETVDQDDVGPGVQVSCRACWGTGDRGGLMEKEPHAEICRGPVQECPLRVRFRRGLLDRVEVPRLADCFVEKIGYRHEPPVLTTETIWRPTPWLRAVVTGHPTVTRVVPLDRKPFWDRAQGHGWQREPVCDPYAPGDHLADLPPPVFDALEGGARILNGRMACFDTESPAVDALGAAVVRAARNLIKEM